MRPSLSELVGESAHLRRTSLPFASAALVALGTHVGLLSLFAVLGVWPLVYFNVFSVATFVVVWGLARRQSVRLAMSIAVAEVIAHQVFAVMICGDEPGFQYYLLCTAPLALMLPGVGTRGRILAAATPALAFVVLLFVSPDAPSYPLPTWLAPSLGTGNLLLSFSALWLWIYFYRHGAEQAEASLAALTRRSEQMLHGILPPPIVERLRDEPDKTVADAFDEATVLFADLVGFTPLSARKTPEELVALLDTVFASFDDLVQERGLEKIKTIGDAYMVAGGVPEPREDHVEAMADLALAIRDVMVEHRERLGEPLGLRMGLHVGPVVAGVIGKTKFAYDLWGDAVNTAARMESHGEPGRVHVTAEIAERLEGRFTLESRGEVEVKGKGPMQTFWLERLEPTIGAR